MSRPVPFFGFLSTIVIVLLAIVFANEFGSTPLPAPTVPTVASSTLTVSPPVIPSASPTHSLPAVAAPSENLPKTPVKAKPIVPAASPSVPVATTTVTIVAAPLPSSGSASFDTAAAALRGALVNIMCLVPDGSSLHSISGSGVFIDSKGIILTNAHVAQYFLLADRGVSCTIRSGSPALDEYKAELIYISPAWVHANATVLTQATPIGTGEFDFALLAVTKSTSPALAFPTTFPSVPLASMQVSSGTPVVIASYGAQFLAPDQIQSDLFPTLVFGSVKDIFTFATNTVDVLALGGSAAAQEGSSGGGVVDAFGSLIGTITTSTMQGTTNSRSLDAITASYVRSEYSREMGGSSLDTLLSEPTASSIADFAPQIPVLESILTANLP